MRRFKRLFKILDGARDLSYSELRSLLAQMKPSKVGLEPPPVNFLKKTDVADDDDDVDDDIADNDDDDDNDDGDDGGGRELILTLEKTICTRCCRCCCPEKLEAQLRKGRSLLLLVPREKQKLGKDISRRMSTILNIREPRSDQVCFHL